MILTSHYLLRDHKTEEAKAVFSIPGFCHPFIWFGIQTLVKWDIGNVPSSFRVIGCPNPPVSALTQTHKVYGTVVVSEDYYNVIGSFDWAENINKAQFETYQEMAGLAEIEFILP